MIKAVIVEDDDSVVSRLKGYLAAWSEKTGEHVSVTRFADAETFLDRYMKPPSTSSIIQFSCAILVFFVLNKIIAT